jgi:hypothetical protein
VPVAPLLWVLPPGSEVGAVADLLMSEEMRRLLMTAKDRSDIVLVVADSVQTGGAQSLASMVDAVLVETEQGRTTRSELVAAAHALGVLGSTFVGTVFVGRGVTRRRDAFSPDTGLSQRQLPSAPPSALPAGGAPAGAGPAGPAPEPPLDADPRPADPAAPEAPAGSSTGGTAAASQGKRRPKGAPRPSNGR